MAKDINNISQVPRRSIQDGDHALVAGPGGTAMVNIDSIGAAADARIEELRGWIAGRQTYETLAAAQAAGEPANGELVEVWNDAVSSNNGYWGWSATLQALVRQPFSPAELIRSAESRLADKSDSVAVASPVIKKIPKTAVHKTALHGAVFSRGALLSYYDDAGKFISDHDHYGQPQRIPASEEDVVWGVFIGGKIAGWFDSTGAFHSDHSHDEIDLIQLQISDLKRQQRLRRGHPGITSESVVDGETHVFATGDDGNVQLSPAGANWSSHVVHNNIIRAMSDYSLSVSHLHNLHPDGEVLPGATVLQQQLVTGQSLSLGSRGYLLSETGEYTFDADNGGVGDLHTTACPEDVLGYCLTLDNGARDDGVTLIATRESADGVLGESVVSSFLISRVRAARAKFSGISPRVAGVISGVGGVSYDNLKKGTAAYSSALSRTQSVAAAAAANGWGHVVSHIRIIHGESQWKAADSNDATRAGYAAVIREWVSDYQSDLMAITGQAFTPPGVLCQMNTQTENTVNIPLAQLDAHDSNADIVLIGPKYWAEYFDSAHMLADGYVRLGELESMVLSHWMAGRKWQPLKVLSAIVTDNVVVLTFNNVADGSPSHPGPMGQLKADTETVSDPGNWGFELMDAGSAVINEVSITGESEITLTLSEAPTDAALTYALQTDLRQPVNGPRGCIRDSDTRLLSRFDSRPIYNWLCAFSIDL